MDRRTVAQFGSALHWGCRGRRFKSCQSDVQPHPFGGGFSCIRTQGGITSLRGRGAEDFSPYTYLRRGSPDMLLTVRFPDTV